MNPEPRPRDVYTVTRLVHEVRDLVEAHLPAVWIEGEISNLARPASGHLYFTLKDPVAQVRCAMFRQNNRLLAFRPENGTQALVRGRASLYPGRGEFQIVVDFMEEAGDGALRRAFEALKARLAAEGLFAEARKRPLPVMPRCIGVVTSPGGAAIRDVASVARRRWPGVSLLLYPVPVQGPEAAPAICRALALAARHAACGVLLLTRGGGSLEDLQAFNEETVARAIAECPLPVVSAVGHEIDFCISDFVADRRAATPSAAAELLTPDVAALRSRVDALRWRLRQRIDTTLRLRRRSLDTLARRLRHPRRRIEDSVQRLDSLQVRLARGALNALHMRRGRLDALSARLAAHRPGRRLADLRVDVSALQARLAATLDRRLEASTLQLASLRRALDAVGPRATLARGYSIVQREADGALVRDAGQVQPRERLVLRFASGAARARVEEVDAPRDEDGDPA